MSLYLNSFDETLVKLIVNGGVGILRTDTLYGIVGRADNKETVERIYSIKERTPTKSPIVLIASTDQLFDIYDQKTLDRLHALWPSKTSVILPSNGPQDWLTRSNQSIAYRMPDNEALRTLLRQTGPLIAPSANPEGVEPAMDYTEAHRYFGDEVDFYVDQGRVDDATPSALYRLLDDGWERLR